MRTDRDQQGSYSQSCCGMNGTGNFLDRRFPSHDGIQPGLEQRHHTICHRRVLDAAMQSIFNRILDGDDFAGDGVQFQQSDI